MDAAKNYAVMTLVALIALVLLASIAHAEGDTTGPTCTLSWNPGTGGGPVEGYRVFVGPTATTKTQRAQVTTTSVPCSTLELVAGQQYAHVVAYNAAGVSPPSDTLPFVLVTTAPGRPLNLRLVPPQP